MGSLKRLIQNISLADLNSDEKPQKNRANEKKKRAGWASVHIKVPQRYQWGRKHPGRSSQKDSQGRAETQRAILLLGRHGASLMVAAIKNQICSTKSQEDEDLTALESQRCPFRAGDRLWPACIVLAYAIAALQGLTPPLSPKYPCWGGKLSHKRKWLKLCLTWLNIKNISM